MPDQLIHLAYFAGQSLDRIMQLKERTGNKDMFDVMKKQKHHKLKKLKAANKESKRAADLFLYLNKSLAHGNKGESELYPVTGITYISN